MQLNYKVFGEGDPIVILHGLFGSLDNWQTIAKRLADQFRVYIIDQRNHGKSPHSDTISYSVMAQDLKGFMETHGLNQSHVIGHSMGGKTALQFAVDFPAMVNKLVVVDISPRSYEGGHEMIFEALLGMEPADLRSRGEADEVLSKSIKEFGVRQFLLKNLARRKEGGF